MISMNKNPEKHLHFDFSFLDMAGYWVQKYQFISQLRSVCRDFLNSYKPNFG